MVSESVAWSYLQKWFNKKLWLWHILLRIRFSTWISNIDEKVWKEKWYREKRKTNFKKNIYLESASIFTFLQSSTNQNVHNILQNSEHGEMLWYGQDSYNTHWLWFWIFLFYSEFKCEDQRSVIVIGGFLLWSSNQGSRFKQDEILSALPLLTKYALKNGFEINSESAFKMKNDRSKDNLVFKLVVTTWAPGRSQK